MNLLSDILFTTILNNIILQIYYMNTFVVKHISQQINQYYLQKYLLIEPVSINKQNERLKELCKYQYDIFIPVRCTVHKSSYMPVNIQYSDNFLLTMLLACLI